jgi:hypothetical protein
MTRYQLPDDQERLEALSQQPSAGALADEIGLARWLVEKSAARGAYGLTNSLLATISRLSVSHESALVRASDQLSKQAVLSVGRQIVEIVMSEIETLPLDEATCNACCDRIMKRVFEAVGGAENSDPKKKQPLRLEKAS